MSKQQPQQNVWVTNNQSYGEHTKKPLSQSNNTLKHKIPISTLDNLKKNDYKNFVLQQENIAQTSRHGLFTQPMHLATGDRYYDKKPESCPKNMVVNPKLQDRVKPQLFSRLGSTNLDDPYKDKFRQQQLYDKQKVNLIPHKESFIPTNNKKTIKHSQFQHMKEYQDKVFNTRDQNGKVKLGKKGFVTNPMKRGYGTSNTGHLFSQYEYKGTPYDAENQKQFKDRIEHKAKIPKPFVGTSKTNHVFTPDHDVHAKAIDDPYMKKMQKSKSAYGNWNPTNPSKKGYEKTFTRFPNYIEQGEKPKITQRSLEKPWIHNYNGTSKHYGQTLAKPCPVPSQLILNQLRRNK